MSKIKPQLIIYRHSRHLDNSEACIKKRLYLSKFEFCKERKSYYQMKRIFKARICKYIRKARCDMVIKWNFNINSFYILISSLHLSQICVQSGGGPGCVRDFSERKERTLIKRAFHQQKRLAKCKLELQPSSDKKNVLKALFKVRNLKKLEIESMELYEGDLPIFKDYLQNAQRRKPWIAIEVQKIKLEFIPWLDYNDDDDEMNELLVQYFEKLLDLKELLNESRLELTLSLNFRNVRAEVNAKVWILLAKIMKEIENIVEIQYSGPKKKFVIALKSLKDMKRLRRLDLKFKKKNNCENELLQILGDSSETIGESLTDFAIRIKKLDCSKDWIRKFQGLPRLQSFCLSGSVKKLDQRFFLQLSDCLKIMTNLRDLKIRLDFDTSISISSRSPSVKQLLETIGGLVKLDSLEFLLIDHSGERSACGMKGEGAICEPLKNLKSLRTLDYCLSTLNAVDDEMKQLLVILSQMKELEELSLRFSIYENLKDQNLISIFRVIAGMKWLRTVNIEFGCSNMRNEFMGVFFEVLMRLRYLEEVELRICRTSENTKFDKNLMKDICKRLEIEKKIPIRLIIWTEPVVKNVEFRKRQKSTILLIFVSFCVFLLSYFILFYRKE